MDYYLPIAIDLGASSTGVWTSCYTACADPAEQAKGLVITVAPNELTLMMPGRTAMRHMRRNYKRRKLAKLLACLWLDTRWPVPGNEREAAEIVACRRFAMGLMNRRGYTHFSLEEKLANVQMDGLEPALASLGLDTGDCSATEWLEIVVADPATARETLNEREVLRLRDEKRDKPALTEHIKKNIANSEYKPQDVRKVVNHIRACLVEAADSGKSGHKARSEYFAAIRADLVNTDSGVLTCKLLQMQADEIANLLGHIGNLNLRALRRYFHDKTKKSRKQLDIERFHAMWLGYFQRWTFVGEPASRREDKRQFRRQWLAWLKDAATREDLWSLLTRHDPGETIPPFEAQNNRRPPECQSLLIHPDGLDALWPAKQPGTPAIWHIWAQTLAREDAQLADGLGQTAAFDSRAIHRRAPGDTGRTLERQRRWYDARLLQRALDRSRERDPFKLRLLASEDGASHGATYGESLAALERVIGKQHSDAFLTLARKYYAEAAEARAGMWFADQSAESHLLRPCGAHPPQKRKVQASLLGGILCSELDQDAAKDLRGHLLTDSVSPPQELAGGISRRRRRISTCLNEFATLQKELGSELRLLYFENRDERSSATDRRQWGKTQNRTRAWNAYSWSVAVAGMIGAKLEHSQSQIERYSNPYSLAQLHNLFFTDRGGFASNCRGCLTENAWRARLDSQGNADAPRLPADSVRPFDGALARLLRAKAKHIADGVVAAISLPDDATAISVPLLLEENRFEFTEQLATLKEAPRKEVEKFQKRGQQRREEWEARWASKWERIQQAGSGHCPYCGETIGDSGDFDHIVSRAATRAVAGYAFDAEPNLIWAHKHCNTRKGAADYALEQLASQYLQAVFDSTDQQQVHATIAEQVQSWLDSRNDRRAFHQLDGDLQRAVRHALFVPGLRDKVLARIANQNRARVNGTQRWFARQLRNALEHAFERNDIPIKRDYSLHRVIYTDVGELRQRLAREADIFVKPAPQPPYSHTVDAALVFALASTNPKARRVLGLSETDEADRTEFVEPDRVAALLARSLDIIRMRRRPKYAEDVKEWHQPLLKANSIGERFVPIGVDREQRVWVGFSTDNRFELSPPKPEKSKSAKPKPDPRLILLQQLWPVLCGPEEMDEPDIAVLGRLAGQRESGVLWLKVDRRRAFEHLLASKNQPDNSTSRQLTALLYIVQKCNLASVLNLDGTKEAPKAGDLLNDKYFSIKVKFAGIGGSKERKLTLPAKDAWQRLCDDERLRPHLGVSKIVRKQDDGPQSDRISVDWDGLMADHFKAPSSGRAHRRNRQAHSLPRIPAGTGSKFRTRRMDPEGRPVFQLTQDSGGAYKGFAAADNELGFDEHKPQLLDVFANSPTLTPQAPTTRATRIIPFDRATRFTSEDKPGLEDAGIDWLEIIPASKGRREVRAQVTWNGLVKMIPGIEVQSLDHQSSSLLLDNDQAKAIAANLQRVVGIGRLGLGPRIPKAKLQIEWMNAERVTVAWAGGTGAGSRKSKASDDNEPVAGDSE